MEPSWHGALKVVGTTPNPADVEDGLDQVGNFHFIGVSNHWRPFADVRITPSVIDLFALFAYSAICAHLLASA
jgi:hypothetical protein